MFQPSLENSAGLLHRRAKGGTCGDPKKSQFGDGANRGFSALDPRARLRMVRMTFPQHGQQCRNVQKIPHGKSANAFCASSFDMTRSLVKYLRPWTFTILARGGFGSTGASLRNTISPGLTDSAEYRSPGRTNFASLARHFSSTLTSVVALIVGISHYFTFLTRPFFRPANAVPISVSHPCKPVPQQEKFFHFRQDFSQSDPLTTGERRGWEIATKERKERKKSREAFGFWCSLHCYPSISRILAKIDSAASTQRRKDAKTRRGECMLIWSFRSESLRLCDFGALNSLGCGSPCCVLLRLLPSPQLRLLHSLVAAPLRWEICG